MMNFLKLFSIAVFSVFVGSQITEGALLVPYWQSLSSEEFYSYFQSFGPSIAQFYTVLTIIALIIPIVLSAYLFKSKLAGLNYALISTLFAVLFTACFYVYFKGANELFFQAAFNDVDLHNELVTWSKWHWGRIGLEVLSLVFLILAIGKGKQA